MRRQKEGTRKKYAAACLRILIGIIFLGAAALIVPTLREAREQARRSSCRGNLKNIGLLLAMYSQDYDIPDHQPDHRVTIKSLFDTDVCDNPDVFVCPSGGKHHGSVADVDEWTDYVILRAKGSERPIAGYCKYHLQKYGETWILYKNGHVRWSSIDKAKEIFDEIIFPPLVNKEKRFFGTAASYSGCNHNNLSPLSGGPGKIVGKAILNNEPLSGLSLRLVLNDSVRSQWATTDSEGIYSIAVPYGEYNINGYEIDTDTAHKVLAGKISYPENRDYCGSFQVQEGTHGCGLTLAFVDPVKKSISKNRFSLSEEIIINWEPYPGASHYKIQILETDLRTRQLFDWLKRPTVFGTSINLKEHVELKPGHFYAVEIDAIDDNKSHISSSISMYVYYDFEIVE